MSSHDRRATARRRARGRGVSPLRFEPLEGRQLLAASVAGPTADLLATQFSTIHSANWGDLFHASGTISNQGTATTTAAVPVDIFASTTPILGTAGSTTLLLGTAQIPAGLQPGQSYNFDQIVGLPPASLGATLPSNQTLYITLWVDPHKAVPEASTTDKSGLGLGIDTSTLTIAPHQPANLVGTALNLTPTWTAVPNVISWGDSFNITEQITNKGEGDAPPTRARVVLTPDGATPGGPNDVTIGNIAVPNIPAFESTNVVQNITLPAVEPAALNGSGQFTVSVVQDADYLTQPIYPQVANQGSGLDQGPLAIAPNAAGTTAPRPLPDLAPATVTVSQPSLNWGQSFQVGAVIQNVGLGNAGGFTVRFVATGVTGDVSHGVFLGDTTVPSLAAGAATSVTATVQLPSKLPFGTTLASPAYARVYAVVDPDDAIDQATHANNTAASAPVLLTVAGTTGATTVPTYAQSIYANATTAIKAAQSAQSTKTTKPVLGTATTAGKQVKKKKPDFLASLTETITGTLEHQFKVLPTNVNKLLQRTGVTQAPAKAKPAKVVTIVKTTPAKK